MRVLVGCEYSQVVLEQFLMLGHDAYSCDILPSEGKYPERHLQMDIYDAIKLKKWDMGLFFTPCTFSCNSGIRWLYNSDGTFNTERWEGLEKYAGMLRDCLNSDIPLVSCENPIPHRFAVEIIGRKYDQAVQPYEFGHTTSKRTCFWLKGLPKLIPTNIIPKELRTQDIWLAPPGPNRWKERSKSFIGIAKAMASQWGSLELIKQSHQPNLFAYETL